MFDTAVVEEDAFGMPLAADVPPLHDVFDERLAARAEATRVITPAMQALVAAVDAVLEQAPAELPGPQALADATAMLAQVERLRGGALGRIADVDARKLYVMDGAPTTGTWVAQQQTSLDRGEVALARRMSTLPLLDEAVRDGLLSIEAAERVGKALSRLRRHVDRRDGLIDGQDAEQALIGVIGNGVRGQVCQALGGLADDDPRLVRLVDDLATIVELPTSEIARLEAAFVLLARQVELAVLPGALAQLVDALLPNELEKRAEDAHRNRGFGVRLKEDGAGWRVTDGDLDLETGELLHAFLHSEMAVDPDNPVDTAEHEQLRADGWQAGDELPPGGGPRSLRQRRHDALRNGLRRYLDSGIAGMRDKVAPHISVIAGLDTLEGAPGSLPAVGASGARLPASLVRRWLCNSALSRFVLSLGGKVIETSHTERTLKAHERRAKRIETGGLCQVAGCRCGPGTTLVPHHPNAYARTGLTSLDETVAICEPNHHDIHVGKKTLRLKDGRWLNESGFVDGSGLG